VPYAPSGSNRNRKIVRQSVEKKWECNETVHQLLVDFKNTYDPIRREVLYDISIEFGIRMKLVKLTEMCLKEPFEWYISYSEWSKIKEMFYCHCV
jgi:hypothetical protein